MTAPAPRPPLVLAAPLDVAASLEPFRRWGDDLLDRWDGRRLLRALPTPRGWVALRAADAGSPRAPALAVEAEPAGLWREAELALAGTFVVAGDAFERLRRVDPVIAALDARHPGLRPVLQPDLFTALVRSVSAQQVNLRWAAETRRRLTRAFGAAMVVGGETAYRLDAERLADARPDAVRALQSRVARPPRSWRLRGPSPPPN
jgi:DNA-3-methyladenine glycosylase II